MKGPITMLMMTALFLFTACQQSATTDNKASASIYPENEIPISTTSDEALQQLVDGLHYLDQGNRIKAAPFFDKAIELDPKCVSALIYRAQNSTSWKEWGERRDKALAMRDQANEGEQMILAMFENGKTGDDTKALALAKKLVEKYPKSARATEVLANQYAELEDTDNARDQYAKAIALNPDFIKAIKNLGDSYLFTSPKDFDQAEKYKAMVVDKAPKSSRAQIDLGDTYRAQNKLEKALASYAKAVELDPNDDVGHSKAGHANSFLGNYDAARQNFKDARAVSQYGLGSYDFEAFTYLYEGDHKKAMSSLMDAVTAIDAMDVPEGHKEGAKMSCINNCAMIAMHHGDAKQAKEMVEMLRPLSVKLAEDLGAPNAVRNQTARMQYWDAVVAAMGGDYKGAAAQADMIKATMESSNDADKLNRYHRVHGMVNYQQKNYDKALEHLSQLNPDNVYDTYWNAKANQMAGNTDKAMELMKGIATNNFNSIGYALTRNEANAMLKPTKG